MKKRVRAALAAATLAGGAVATVTAATPAFAAGGGINVTAACKAQYPNALEEWLVTAVAADAGSIYGWQCWDGSVYELGGVSMRSACIEQYGSGAVAYVVPPYNAYSWRCT
jgi:hypothetical protein